MSSLQVIENEQLRAEVDPRGGAYLRSFQIKRDGEFSDVFQKGKSLFVMAPYPNRVLGGLFPWKGEMFALNHPQDPATAIHGVFRYVPWEIAARSGSEIRLSLSSKLAAQEFQYPSDYEALLSYRLKDSTLEVSLECTNTGSELLPFGTGPHMYGLRHVFGSKGPELRHQATTWFPPEKGQLVPSSKERELPTERQHQSFAPWSTDWDHCVANWGDTASIRWPDVGLRLDVVDKLGNCPYLQIWNTEAQEICALEPQTMVPTKLGDTKESKNLGTILLSPGERFKAQWDFVFTLDGSSN